jgi:hypothetical protein
MGKSFLSTAQIDREDELEWIWKHKLYPRTTDAPLG